MGTLILQDGTILQGESFGAIGGYEGEIVFNTSSVGYQEIFTDPANAKQIIVMAYPEIGNYGINDFDFESDNPAIAGVIVKNCAKQESHYKSRESLSNYLKMHNVVALEGIDTRSLVKKIREYGSMTAFITSNDLDKETINTKLRDIQNFKIENQTILDVSTKSRYIFNPSGKINVALIDYGVKKGMLNALAKLGCKITVYRANVQAKEILENNFDALFLSSGPANPADCTSQILQLKQMMGQIPIFGVGLGCEMLAIGAGATTYKMKQGHRGNSYPVINLENNKVMMTSQNHGYAIDIKSIQNIMRPTYKNLNDDTVEGFEISSLGIYAVQFYPEGKSGSNDGLKVYQEWVNIAKRDIERINEVKNER